jgi:hypothetical protein
LSDWNRVKSVSGYLKNLNGHAEIIKSRAISSKKSTMETGVEKSSQLSALDLRVLNEAVIARIGCNTFAFVTKGPLIGSPYETLFSSTPVMQIQ